MREFYHIVPENLKGDHIMPLNDLERFDSDLYESAKLKYKGREHVMQHRIALLDCMRNDVVFLCPIHPQKIREALLSVNPQWNKPWEFFVIPEDQLDLDRTVIYKHTKRPKGTHPPVEDFIPYDTDYLDEHDEVPQILLEYMQEVKERGGRPFAFLYTPHVLYQGPIQVSKLQRLIV